MTICFCIITTVFVLTQLFLIVLKLDERKRSKKQMEWVKKSVEESDRQIEKGQIEADAAKDSMIEALKELDDWLNSMKTQEVADGENKA